MRNVLAQAAYRHMLPSCTCCHRAQNGGREAPPEHAWSSPGLKPRVSGGRGGVPWRHEHGILNAVHCPSPETGTGSRAPRWAHPSAPWARYWDVPWRGREPRAKPARVLLTYHLLLTGLADWLAYHSNLAPMQKLDSLIAIPWGTIARGRCAPRRTCAWRPGRSSPTGRRRTALPRRWSCSARRGKEANTWVYM